MPPMTEIPTVDGLYDDIAEAAYHADVESISQTGIKTLLTAPALYHWGLTHPPPPKDTYDLGHVAHTLILGVGSHPEVPHRFDPKTKADLGEAEDMRSPSTRAHAAEIRAAGNIPLLRKEIDKAEAMAESLQRHAFAMEILTEGKPEVTGYLEHQVTGQRRRVRVDWLHPQVLGDVKTAESADPDVFKKRAAEYGYFIQAPYYLDVLRALGHPAKAFAFVVIEKNPPYPVSVIQLGARSIKLGRKRYTQGLEILRDCKEADVWPGYIQPDTYAQVEIPDYHFFEKSVT